MKRNIFDDDHEAFRHTVRTFCEKEIVPHHQQWEDDGVVPCCLGEEAGEVCLLGFMMPEECGGGVVEDFRYKAVLQGEIKRAGASGVGFVIHTVLVSTYLLSYANEEQRQCWFS